MKLSAIDRKETLRMLGARGGAAPDERTARILDECEEKMLATIVPRYVAKRFDIAGNDGERVALKGCSLALTGRDICCHLERCGSVILCAATLSGGVDELIRLSQINDMERAVIYDAMGGVAIEAVLDLMEEELAVERPGTFFTYRFSPGYGDFPIETQPAFLSTLDANRRIGLYVTDSFLLTPTKSVTCVIGESLSPIDDMIDKCALCASRDNCGFRKEGTSCDGQEPL